MTHDSESLSNQPTQLTELQSGAALFIWTLRQWVSAARAKVCIHTALDERYRAESCPDGVALADELFCILSAAAIRPVNILCHHANYISPDEERLVLVLQALERKELEKAQAELTSIISWPLNRTFCRTANEYVKSINQAKLSCVGIRKLRVV
ncbi:MAG: hypothetical protein AAF993_08545 [Pseudomonadota bacterium]